MREKRNEDVLAAFETGIGKLQKLSDGLASRSSFLETPGVSKRVFRNPPASPKILETAAVSKIVTEAARGIDAPMVHPRRGYGRRSIPGPYTMDLRCWFDWN